MGIKKPSSLKIAFWRFLFMLLVGLFGAVAIPFLLVTVSTTLGLTTYGDYSEIRANELAPILAATPDLSDVQIPMGIEYYRWGLNMRCWIKTTSLLKPP